MSATMALQALYVHDLYILAHFVTILWRIPRVMQNVNIACQMPHLELNSIFATKLDLVLKTEHL